MKNSISHGFTLVEILIVTAIIGLLAAIGIPYIINAYNNSQDQAKERAVAEVEKAKGVLTLPATVLLPGAMGLEDENLVIQDDPLALSNLCEALRIRTVDDLSIGGDSIKVGSLLLKASYVE